MRIWVEQKTKVRKGVELARLFIEHTIFKHVRVYPSVNKIYIYLSYKTMYLYLDPK
jgi:hypothetical protein